MNQILVSEKLYVTPELKKKKKLYKFNFVISVILVVALFGYYIYGVYERDSSDKSDEILSQIEVKQQDVGTNNGDSTIKLQDNVLVVVLDDTNDTGEEINLDDLMKANRAAMLDGKKYKTDAGAEYGTSGYGLFDPSGRKRRKDHEDFRDNGFCERPSGIPCKDGRNIENASWQKV